MQVPRRAVAADADAHRARAAALALRLPYRVQDALLHAVEIAIGPAEVRELDRNRVLRVGVFAPAALENELDLDVVSLPLLEMDDRRARAKIVAGVFPRNRIDRIRTELAAPRRFGNRLANLLAHPDLIGADGHFDLERRHAGVLADGALAIRGEIDVLRDDGQRLRRARAFGFDAASRFHGRPHVWRKVGRRSNDELQHAVEE